MIPSSAFETINQSRRLEILREGSFPVDKCQVGGPVLGQDTDVLFPIPLAKYS